MHVRWIAFIPKRTNRSLKVLTCCSLIRLSASIAARACRCVRCPPFLPWTICRKNGKNTPTKTPSILADNRRDRFSNARLPELRVFVCRDLTTEEHRVEVHEASKNAETQHSGKPLYSSVSSVVKDFNASPI